MSCRQKEERLLDLLNAARYGKLEQQHLDLLAYLERPLAVAEGDGVQATKLYPTNAQVDGENAMRLSSKECSGDVETYMPEDFGKKADLEYLAKNCLAADPLQLRVGAQVSCVCLPR